MNLLKIYLPLIFILSTIPIESKISMQNAQNSVSHFFARNKQEHIFHKECLNVKQLELLCEHGDISIHSWNQKSSIIELKKVGSQAQVEGTNIEFLQYEDLLQMNTICSDKKNIAAIYINIIIPEQTSVKIALKKGNIIIKNIAGIIQAQTDWGAIDIIDGSNNVTIHSKRGNIMIQRESMKDAHLIKATTDNGNISLQVPQHINSKIHAQTKGGKIYSDLLITTQSKTTKLTDETYKQQQHQLSGTIIKNNGEPIAGLIDLETKHGAIKIKNFI